MHTIEIVNLRNNEKITHSFVVIKGFVKNSQNSSCAKRSDRITLTSRKSDIYLECILKNNCFKFLIELTGYGLNKFTITFCCVSFEFALEYVEKITGFIVTPLYIICEGHNGKFQAPTTENNSIESACKRILTAAKLLQCVIAEKLNEQNFGRITFKLEQKCRVFYSKLPCNTARQLSQKELWSYFAKEIINSDLNWSKSKFLALLSCTQFRSNGENNKNLLHEEVLKQTEAYVALGAGGLALFGTGCLYTWPENVAEVISRFLNKTRIDSDCFMDDSCYRGTFGSCFSTTLGSVLHELCHCFDLGHTENGIMGRGFDNIHKVFTLEHLIQKRNNYFEDDETYLTKSCAVLLRYHKWTLDGVSKQKKAVLNYDSSLGLVKSTSGIRVIEIRRETDEMVLESWVFTSKVLKFLFKIDEDVFNNFRGQRLIVVVEDANGNIIKENMFV